MVDTFCRALSGQSCNSTAGMGASHRASIMACSWSAVWRQDVVSSGSVDAEVGVLHMQQVALPSAPGPDRASAARRSNDTPALHCPRGRPNPADHGSPEQASLLRQPAKLSNLLICIAHPGRPPSTMSTHVMLLGCNRSLCASFPCVSSETLAACLDAARIRRNAARIQMCHLLQVCP